MIDALRGRDTEIEFFGRVIDDGGLPIEEAKINLSVRHFDPTDAFLTGNTRFDVESNSAGEFELKGKVGSHLYLETIEREGYEFIPPESTKRAFSFARGTPIFKPDPAEPVTFRMRKRQEPANVKVSWFSRNIRNGHVVYLGLLEGAFLRYAVPKDPGDPKELHLKIEALLSEDRKAYDLRISVLADQAGVQLKEEVLYLAPQDGYQPSISFRVDVDAPRSKKTIYYRRGDGMMHSRLDAETSAVDRSREPGWVTVTGKALNNLEGSRSFEYDPKHAPR